jgi:hypothetical protein
MVQMHRVIAREAVAARSDYCYPQPNHSRLTHGAHINFGRCSASRAVVGARPKMLGAAFVLFTPVRVMRVSITVPLDLFQWSMIAGATSQR